MRDKLTYPSDYSQDHLHAILMITKLKKENKILKT